MMITSYCSTSSTSLVSAAALGGCECSIPCLLQVMPQFRDHARDGATPSPLCYTSLSSDTLARDRHALQASSPRTGAVRAGDRLQPIPCLMSGCACPHGSHRFTQDTRTWKALCCRANGSYHILTLKSE